MKRIGPRRLVREVEGPVLLDLGPALIHAHVPHLQEGADHHSFEFGQAYHVPGQGARTREHEVHVDVLTLQVNFNGL